MNPTQKNKLTDVSIEAQGNVHIGDIIHNGTGDPKTAIPIALTNLIPTDASYIVGRTKELADIKQKLNAQNATVVVNGIGGMGKTTVARKYMVENAQRYTHRAWLNAAAGLREAFINNKVLLDSLDIRQAVEDLVNGQQWQAAFECVVKKLKDLPSALVVIDNANVLADLVECKKYFESAHCHFIITSRAEPQGWAIVHIDELPEADAVRMFKNIHPSVSETDENLKALVKHLFYHPLLIELVAKTAKANALDTAKLKQTIQDNFIHDPVLKKRKIDVTPHSDATNETVKRATIEDYIWLIFQNVHNLYDHAKDLLRAFTLLPPATSFDEDFLESHFAQWELTEGMYDTLDLQLVESGWLERDYTTDKPSYKMHPLIADVLIKHLDLQVGFAEVYIKSVIALIDYSSTNPKHNLLQKNRCKPLAERLSNLFFSENIDWVAELLDSLGYLEQNFGSYHKAAAYKERALLIAESIFKKEHETVAKFQNNLGWTYQLLGNYDRAIQLLESSLESNLRNFGADHPEVAINLSNLAEVYRNLGNYTIAVVLFETALASDLKNFGDNHPEVAKRQSNLATVLSDIGDYTRAITLFEKALASDLKNFDAESIQVALIQSNLATVYNDLGDYKRAAALFEKAFTSDLKNFGAAHPEVAKKQINLGTVYSKLGEYTKSIAILEMALASNLKNFGTDHPNVAINQNNLACVYYDTGRCAEAKVLWQSAYVHFLKNLGAEHHNTVACKRFLEM